MKEEKISIHRVIPILGMLVSAGIAAGVLCYINQLEIDQIICVTFLVISFMPIVIFELTFERRREMLGNNNQTTFRRAMNGFFICSLITLGISFLPEYFRPVIILPVIMSAFSNDMLGLITGLFFNILLAFTTGGSFNELLAYTMLVLVGGMLSKMLKYVEYRLFIGIIYLFSSVLFPNIFYYFANESITFNNLILGLINGFIVAVYVIAFYPNTREKTFREKHYYYGDILADEFVQVREIRNASASAYYHARKVSELAYKYALQLDLDADLAAAAGFYYHLGKWEGNPPIERGVRKAHQLCFPEELIQILREYNGTDDLPSTPESALVHIIDGVLNKMEIHNEELGTSKWNRELLIHQTLNEFSSAGLYDKSGLSINTYIKIRDWLVQEELL
ncbi:MAG: hypothetical protein IJA07_02305 [Agathobacter sp.]|nr:hypothetical protein [Agathobacter sp.]